MHGCRGISKTNLSIGLMAFDRCVLPCSRLHFFVSRFSFISCWYYFISFTFAVLDLLTTFDESGEKIGDEHHFIVEGSRFREAGPAQDAGIANAALDNNMFATSNRPHTHASPGVTHCNKSTVRRKANIIA